MILGIFSESRLILGSARHKYYECCGDLSGKEAIG